MTKSTKYIATPTQTRAQRIASLTAQLNVLQNEEAAEREALLDSVKPIMEYTISPSEVRRSSFDFVYDPEVTCYTITGTCTNKLELAAVGNTRHLHEGSMRYYFNGATGRLIGSVGGGNIHLASTEEAYAQVSAFLVASPEGGDITEIVVATRKQGTGW